MRSFVAFFTLLFYTQYAVGQGIGLSQNPASTRWNEIKTPRFRLIYPRELEAEAQRTANRLALVVEPVSRSLNRIPRSIPIVLQNNTNQSNGFVSIFPRRSEFFTTAPQGFNLAGNADWLSLLAVHEYRHVVQFEKSLRGISKWAYYLGGSFGQAATAVGVPSWFWEGDAVGVETALTPFGRGRIPNFDLQLRANMATIPKRWSYSKAVCGSFKDFVPNHYVLGYYMTTQFRRQHGLMAWSKVLDRYYSFPFYPFSFSRAIKKTTGERVEALYQQTMDSLQTRPNFGASQRKDQPAQPKIYTDYHFPQFLSSGRVVALKSGLAHIPQFVEIDSSGREKVLFKPGFLNTEMLSVAQNTIFWTEYGFDKRWGERDYSVVKSYNVVTRKLKTLTKKSRILSVAASTDAQKLIAVQRDDKNNYGLAVYALDQNGIIDAPAQNVAIFAEPTAVYIQPRWFNDNQNVLVIKLLNGKKQILKIDTKTNQQTILFETPLNIANAVAAQNTILFNVVIDGIEQIGRISAGGASNFVGVTNAEFGAYNATVSADGKTLCYENFQPKGHQIVREVLNVGPAQAPYIKNELPTNEFVEPLVSQENNVLTLNALNDTLFASKPYRKGANLLNLYQWGPVATSTLNTLNLGVASQDILSSTALEVGYNYDANERQSGFSSRLTYRGWYPMIDVGFESGGRRTTVFVDRQAPLDSLRTDTWNYQQYTVGVRLPLQLTHSRFGESLVLGVSTSRVVVSGYDLPVRRITEFGNGSFQSVNYSVSYSKILRQARRDVSPRLGFAVSALFRHVPFKQRLRGEVFSLNATIFLPGLAQHHGIIVRNGVQIEDFLNYRFTPGVAFARGQNYLSLGNLNVTTAEYRFPICYPDLALGRFVYVKRLKSNLFFDNAYTWTTDSRATVKSAQFQTYGFDLTMDFHLLRWDQPLEIGIRTLYLGNTGKFLFQPLLINIGF